jgi:predicted cupin superfamily sugar epimerase
MRDARYWIDRLGLVRHPEGGYYRETYRARESIARRHLPERFNGDRSFSTAIYFLLTGNEASVFHRIKQDEVWHFYEGSTITIHVIDARGGYSATKVGRAVERGESLQAVVPAGCLFGASVDDPESYALVGCTVAPGFDFDDFERPRREELLTRFPQHRAIIEKLTQ